MKYLVSDTHFFHNKVIQFMNRPYKDSNEMTEKIIEEWNSIVKPEDSIYHLGDFFFGTDYDAIKSVLSRLNGTITLIAGNHDTPNKVAFLATNGIRVCAGINVEGVLLTHYPVHPSLLSDLSPRSGGEKDTLNIHGHTHHGSMEDPRYFNMCWDVREKDGGQHILRLSDVKARIREQMINFEYDMLGTTEIGE